MHSIGSAETSHLQSFHKDKTIRAPLLTLHGVNTVLVLIAGVFFYAYTLYP